MHPYGALISAASSLLIVSLIHLLLLYFQDLSQALYKNDFVPHSDCSYLEIIPEFQPYYFITPCKSIFIPAVTKSG